MKTQDEEKKIAVLIDADNAQRSKLGAILAELSNHGHILVKRAYGDWSSVHLKGWKESLNDLAILPVQQFAYTIGKNSSDMALVIDAMDLLYTDKYDAFALVSSDSDFTKLASRLRESEKYVFGVGKQTTPLALINACNNFISTEVLRDLNPEKDTEESNSGKPHATDVSPVKDTKKSGASKSQATNALSAEQKKLARLINILGDVVGECSDDDGWAPLSSCGSLIKRKHPNFDARTYGHKKLGDLIKSISSFVVQRKTGSGSGEKLWVKDKRNKAT